MKKLFITTIAASIALIAFAQSQKVTVTEENEIPSMPRAAAAQTPRRVALVVQNHAERGTEIPFMALTDALTATLSGCGLQVVNPYNAVGVNQNRTASGEKTPEVSAMELARKLKADGAITASVLEFLDSTIGTSTVKHQFSIRITLTLADAWTGATVCEGVRVEKDSPRYTNNHVLQNRLKCLSDLMYAAADECAVQLRKSPGFLKWMKTSVDDSRADGLTERLKQDASFRKWIEAMIDERLSKRMADDSKNRVPPPPDDPWLTLSDIDGVVQEHIDSMRADPVFRDNYDTAQAAIDHIPLVVVGGLVDLTNGKSPTADLDNLLASASQNVRITLLRTRLVDAKDDSVITEMTDRIVKNGKSPTEDGALMAVLKQHGSPDFFMVGDIKYFLEKKAHKYRIRLALHNLHTGKIVWEDFKDVSKNTGVSK